MRACWFLLFATALARSTDADTCSCALDQPSIELRVADTNELVPVYHDSRTGLSTSMRFAAQPAATS